MFFTDGSREILSEECLNVGNIIRRVNVGGSISQFQDYVISSISVNWDKKNELVFELMRPYVHHNFGKYAVMKLSV